MVVDSDNLCVTAGTAAYAELVGGGASADWSAVAFGIGSGNTAPAKTDTDLSAAPKYYRSLNGAASFPSTGTVSLSVGVVSGVDFGAYGITIQEWGLYANQSLVTLPAAVGTTFPAWAATTAAAWAASPAAGATVVNSSNQVFMSIEPPVWQASHSYSLNTLITDSNGNIQKVTTAGTSGGSHPTWANTLSATTTDNTVTWTCVALSGYTPTTGGSAPSWNTSAIGNLTYDNTVVWQYLAATAIPQPMLAHVVQPSFVFSGSASYVGTWNLTFSV